MLISLPYFLVATTPEYVQPSSPTAGMSPLVFNNGYQYAIVIVTHEFYEWQTHFYLIVLIHSSDESVPIMDQTHE